MCHLQSIFAGASALKMSLIWATLALGLHSFGVYIHNDTLQALGRREDIFKDNSIQLKPLFAKDRITHETMYHYNLSSDIKIYVVDKKVPNMSHEMGRADFCSFSSPKYNLCITLGPHIFSCILDV